MKMELNEKLLLVAIMIQLIVGIGFSYYGYILLVRSGYGKLYNPILTIILGAIILLNIN